ncbi:MAG TPA: hypothetical protein VLJ39_14390 [Tepidisphaeraceae bacterium]|jgi:hypothetical protein|nr:hypothetical protein [Tepidisphaeraceae bacterium]
MNRIAFLLAVLLVAAFVRAEHFNIELTIQPSPEDTTAHSDTEPPMGGLRPRPVCHVKAGAEITLQFFFSSNFPHDIQKKVGVHYFIAPEKDAGTKAQPEPGKPAVLDGRFVMDFKPETGRVGLRQRLHIDQPGTYLVKVISENSDSDHEHFAAIDLIVE